MESSSRRGVNKQAAAREAVDVLHEIATLLNTGLDRKALSVCMSLIENGVNPEALATVIKELRKDTAEAREEHQQRNQERS